MNTEPEPRKQDAAVPATGDWNPVALSVRLPQVETAVVVKLCKDHNAALAAEGELNSNMASALQWAKEQLAAEREKHEGAQHHMEACRALLNVPDDEVLYGAIKELQSQLAAAQAALQECSDCDLDSKLIADAALAKVGK